MGTFTYRILIFGGFSSPPKLYKIMADFFSKQGVLHGYGSTGQSSISVEFVDWMNEKEDAVKIDDFQNLILVCHSLGCQAGLNFYAKHKDKVHSIVLFDYHPFDHSYPDPPQKGLGLGFFPQGAKNSPEIIQEVVSVMKPDKFSYFTEKFAHKNIIPTVPTLTVMATTLVHDGNKLVYSCIDLKRPIYPIPDSNVIQYKAVPKANHFWFMDNIPEYSGYISEIWQWVVRAVSKCSVEKNNVN